MTENSVCPWCEANHQGRPYSACLDGDLLSQASLTGRIHALLVAIPLWLYALYRWRSWYEPYLILGAVQVLERILNPPEPEPAPGPRPLAVASLKVWQTDYGRSMKPVSRPSTRGLVAS